LEPVLNIDKISKRYGKIRAVNELSMQVFRGQVFGILGPNGSGKTTTLSILLGLIKADSGTFLWFDEPLAKNSLKRIGAVIENPNFFPYLSAWKNLEIVALIKDLSFEYIPEVLKITGLFDRRNSKFGTFSFGMKQRLALASALLGNPEVLILDEPTNGLDPQGIAQIREIILQVASKGITIIIASHLLDEVQKICSHVAVLNKGHLLFVGNVSEVLAVSDCVEVASRDQDLLDKTIQTHPEFKSLLRADGKSQIYFTHPVGPDDINEFLFRKGIVLHHLSERKRSLEKHFLELLQENQ
jgi:ABC-2 type transport system ATP-binding protein